MKNTILAVICILAFGCTTVPLNTGSSTATGVATDLNALAVQATQAWIDYKAGRVNYAWAVAQGLMAYQTIIKSEADIKNVVTAWGGAGTLADKLAQLFTTSGGPPAAKVTVIAQAVQSVAAANPAGH